MAKTKATTKDGFEVIEVDDMAPAQVSRARLVLRGTAPYSPGRFFQTEKPKKTDHDEFDENHWRERAHVNAKGNVVIPCQAFYLGLLCAVMQNGEKIKGRGNKTFGDAFKTGVFFESDDGADGSDNALLTDTKGAPYHIDRVRCDKVLVPSNGEPSVFAKGASKRVPRRFPLIPAGWSVSLNVTILSPAITQDVFFSHVRDAGTFIGVGRFRPQSRGRYGRFVIERAEWKN